MSTSSTTGCPMRRFLSCVLEVGVDPNIGERSQRHQPLPGDDLIAWVDAATRHDTVDLGHDIAIGKVQLGLIEISLSLLPTWPQPVWCRVHFWKSHRRSHRYCRTSRACRTLRASLRETP